MLNFTQDSENNLTLLDDSISQPRKQTLEENIFPMLTVGLERGIMHPRSGVFHTLLEASRRVSDPQVSST